MLTFNVKLQRYLSGIKTDNLSQGLFYENLFQRLEDERILMRVLDEIVTNNNLLKDKSFVEWAKNYIKHYLKTINKNSTRCCNERLDLIWLIENLK